MRCAIQKMMFLTFHNAAKITKDKRGAITKNIFQFQVIVTIPMFMQP